MTTGRLRKIFLILSTGLYIALCQQYAAETAELAGKLKCSVSQKLNLHNILEKIVMLLLNIPETQPKLEQISTDQV